eukprot:TRINITY_DN76455_c0_g1_i1.p1 TRINITY_DN76455_c0_g1~~TRINITY_DN76455_c0_g1_i1.p1  ORF type:complete len:150 (+),score=3.68 TRINITY_DN76455_c0_g1_i1:49-450(+)
MTAVQHKQTHAPVAGVPKVGPPVLSWAQVQCLDILKDNTRYEIGHTSQQGRNTSVFLKKYRKPHWSTEGDVYEGRGTFSELRLWEKLGNQQFYCEVDSQRFVKLGKWADFPQWGQRLDTANSFKVVWKGVEII